MNQTKIQGGSDMGAFTAYTANQDADQGNMLEIAMAELQETFFTSRTQLFVSGEGEKPKRFLITIAVDALP